MAEKKYKLEGWSKRYKTAVMFYKYPCCGHLEESIGYSNNIVECYKCNTKLHIDNFEIVNKIKTACKCKICGEEITITPDNRLSGSFEGYMCYKCDNVVAVLFEGHIINPKTIMRPSWNKSGLESLIKIDKNIGFIKVTTDKDMVVLRALNSIARSDMDNYFTSIQKEDRRKSGIIIDTIRDKYLGYILWSDTEYNEGISATVRQIYIVEDEQKKGYGTIVFKWWVENIADKISNVFVVESPNDISRKILVNLGYAKKIEKGLLGIKSLFV